MARYDFEGVVSVFSPTGSRVICDPAPSDTDEDFIAFVACDEAAQSALVDLGYVLEGSPEFYTGNDVGGFRSFRKGDVNLITTPDENFYQKFQMATELAARFNLLDKGDRIALFQAILYDVNISELEPRHGSFAGCV